MRVWSYVKRMFLSPLVRAEAVAAAAAAPLAAVSDEEVQNGVVDCLRELANAGCSTNRVERRGEELCQALGFEDVSIHMLPSYLTVTFGRQRTVSTRISASLTLTRMERIDALIDGVTKLHQYDRQMIPALVRAIEEGRTFASHWVWLAAATLNAAYALAVFRQPWLGVLAAFLVGMVVQGPVEKLASHYVHVSFVVNPIVSLLAGFVATCAAILGLIPRPCLNGLELSMIIALAPGLSLSIGALELSTRSVVSGASRLVFALIAAFLIGLGLSMGSSFAMLLDTSAANATAVASMPPSVCIGESAWWLFLSFPVATLSFLVILDTPMQRFPVCLAAGAIAFFSSYGLSLTPLTAAVQSFVAALAVGLFASAYQAATGLASATVVITGLYFLTPGSLAVGTISSQGSANFGLLFVEISIAIAFGVLVASSVQQLIRGKGGPVARNAFYADSNFLI